MINWIKRHKFWTGIIVAVGMDVLLCATGVFAGSIVFRIPHGTFGTFISINVFWVIITVAVIYTLFCVVKKLYRRLHMRHIQQRVETEEVG